MASPSELPLCSVASDDELLAMESAGGAVAVPGKGHHHRSTLAALGGLALLALAGAARMSSRVATSTHLDNEIVSLASYDAAAQRALHVRYSYGLHEAPCPQTIQEKSESAEVTLPEIKQMIGVEPETRVTFWWAYPQKGIKESDMDDWSAETEFKYHGGYMYTWGTNSSFCLALTPKGEEFLLAPTLNFPSTDMDWHEPSGEDTRLFSWVPPNTAEGTSCTHGCFVYKAADGTKTGLAVIQQERRQMFKAAFDTIDTDHSGEIDSVELKAALQSMPLMIKPKKEQIQKMISDIDDDGSGTIGLEEFLKRMTD